MSRYGNSKVSPAIYAPRQGEEWRGGDEAPRILHLGIRGEWSASRCSRFTHGERHRYPLNKRLGGPQYLVIYIFLAFSSGSDVSLSLCLILLTLHTTNI